MKTILAISDTHGRKDLINVVMKDYSGVDLIFHLGDFSQDMWDYAYEGNVYVVKGNMDPFLPKADYAKEEIVLEVEDLKIWLVHGHKYEAHFSVEKMLAKAKDKGYNLVCYGHTHKAEFKERDGIYFFNPGALKSGSYGIIRLEKGGIIESEIRSL